MYILKLRNLSFGSNGSSQPLYVQQVEEDLLGDSPILTTIYLHSALSFPNLDQVADFKKTYDNLNVYEVTTPEVEQFLT